jgi:hypothetical protein
MTWQLQRDVVFGYERKQNASISKQATYSTNNSLGG